MMRLRLSNWEIDFRHGNCANDLAQVEFDHVSKQATFVLSSKWDIDKPVTKDAIEQTALHEVCHILLARLIYLAELRCVQPGAIEEEEHEVIRNISLIVKDQ
jgi:hypothetical protein